MTPASYKARVELLRQKHVFMRGHSLGSDLMPGWLPIVERLCSDIEQILSGVEKQALRILQIKEKLGELAFYSSFISDAPFGGESPSSFDTHPRIKRHFELVHAARRQSLKTCFMCSQSAELREVRGLYLPLCLIHRSTHPRHLDFAFEQVTGRSFWPPNTATIASRLMEHVDQLRSLGFTELAIMSSQDETLIFRLVSRDPTVLAPDSALRASTLARWPLDPAVRLSTEANVVWVFQD